MSDGLCWNFQRIALQDVLSAGSPRLPAANESTGSVSDSLFLFAPSSCIQVLTLFSFVAETAESSEVQFWPPCWCVLHFWAGTVQINKVLTLLSTLPRQLRWREARLAFSFAEPGHHGLKNSSQAEDDVLPQVLAPSREVYKLGKRRLPGGSEQ